LHVLFIKKIRQQKKKKENKNANQTHKRFQINFTSS